MKPGRPELVVFSARGIESFAEAQQRSLHSCSNCTFIEAATPVPADKLREYVGTAAFAALTPRAAAGLTREVIGAANTSLRGIVIPTTGCEWFDAQSFIRSGIMVSHVPDFSTISCAEFTLGLLIACMRDFPSIMTNGDIPGVGRDLAGKTIGIVGMGNVGRRVAGLCRAFGMTVQAFDIKEFSESGTIPVSKDDLFRNADCISLHIPLTASTRDRINDRTLSLCKNGVVIVNTARPRLVETGAMVKALDSGRVGRYAFDRGYEQGPDIQALAAHPRVIATPHVSWYTRESVAREMQGWVDAIVAMVSGAPVHLIDKETLLF